MQIETNTFTSWDGTELFYRHWLPETTSDKAIIMFHRGHEHSGRWHDVIEKLALPGFNIFAWDARGHGKSPGDRGYADSFNSLVKDVDAFVAYIAKTYNIAYQNIVVFAHSVGSVIASTWVHDYAPAIRGLVLGSPALRVRLYVPFAVPGLRLLNSLRPKSFISSYVKGRLLTHDPVKSRSYDQDPLITPRIAVNILLGLHDAGTRLADDAGAITVPTLVLTSGDDFVVEQAIQRKFYNRLSNNRKEMQTFEGFGHDTFNELDSHLPIAKARTFIQDLFQRDYAEADLRDADAHGHTWREHETLKRPLPWWSPKKLSFAVTKLLMKSVGRLSKGIRIGWRRGFDSGAMLDYVYEKEAQGSTFLGRLLDRAYLNSPGWCGIRQRKVNLEKLLRQSVNRHLQEGEDVRILDIATGHGRYVLDAIKEFDTAQVSALLRDFDGNNAHAGQEMAQEMNLPNVVFEQGDAFDRESLKKISTRPNIAIVSGLYELFPQNDGVRQSLAGVADALAPGGILIYTNQPWHPQMEFIARVLTSHRGGDAWIMRRRTQQEMDQLVAEAGFEKITQEIDDDGIFTVSVARKRSATAGASKDDSQ